MLGRSTIKRFEPIGLTLLFFGIYTTERMKLSLGGVSLRYSFLILIGAFLLKFIENPGARALKLLRDQHLVAFFPFLICSFLSVLASKEVKTAFMVWGYNALTLAVCTEFIRNRSVRALSKPWLFALLAHSSIIFWDEATIAGIVPSHFAAGLLYNTGLTQRPSGFYIAPQFYGTAISLSAFLWMACFGSRSKLSHFVILVLASTWFSMSRTGLVATASTLCMLILALPLLKSVRQEAARIGVIAFTGVIAGALIMNLAAPFQASELNKIFGIRATWTRVCPLIKRTGLTSIGCPIEDLDTATASSEGRRLAEWVQVFIDLKQSPLIGLGYAGTLEKLMGAPLRETSESEKRIQYRFESTWATVASYYGIFGLITLLGALVFLARQVQWNWTLIFPAAYWLIGAHSSQVFARLDIWLPLFVYMGCLCQSQLSNERTPHSDG